MFTDNNGRVSSTKIMSFVGFFAFLLVSVFVLIKAPAAFNYDLFAILAGGGAMSSRVLDKVLNIVNNKIKGGKNE